MVDVIPVQPDSSSNDGPKNFPPLLTVEHQELIRSVERAKIQIEANQQLITAQLTASALHSKTQIEALTRMLDERYTTQTKALDAAFVAQQEAMKSARANDKEAVQAALLAAKEAVEKANTANEKRFENVNEFRGQLADMQSTLISRNEAASQFTALDEKFNARFTGLDEHVKRIQTSVDRGFSAVDSKAATGKENWGYLVGALGIVLTAVVVIMNLVTGQ